MIETKVIIFCDIQTIFEMDTKKQMEIKLPHFTRCGKISIFVYNNFHLYMCTGMYILQ
jgi:hypothetical protein